MTRTNLSDMARQPIVVGVAAFLAGLIIGLPVLGWWLFPVEWTDAGVIHLSRDAKQEYVRLVAAAYAVDLDAQKAGQRIGALGPDWAVALEEAAAGAQGQEALRLSQLKQVVDTLNAAGQLPVAGAAGGGGGLMGLLVPLAGACLVIVLLGAAGFLFLRARSNASSASTVVGRAPARMASEPMEAAPALGEMPAAPGGAQPIQRFLSTYTLGDDVYDDSFSIDGPDGNFLGECGMGISENIGVGDPKKVTAFEVWLFDKNDIRTVTKVIMSEHAFRDEALKSRLAAKGEPVLAAAGDTVTLETATLIVTARIVDMAYGGGALPANSFFERMTVELQAYRKPAA